MIIVSELNWFFRNSEFVIHVFKPFKRQPHKMVKRTQTIRRQ